MHLCRKVSPSFPLFSHGCLILPFTSSLNKNKTDEELNVTVHNYFEQWGHLINVKVFKDRMKRPYAFVQFEVSADKGRGETLD